MQMTSKPQPMLVNATEYFTIVDRVLIPTSFGSEVAKNIINALRDFLTWADRTPRYPFPDDRDSLMTTLHNLLTVPLHFSVTAVQLSNLMAGQMGLVSFLIPNGKVTAAISGRSCSWPVI